MPTAIILGAKSAIGRAIAVQLASRNYNLILAARNIRQLDAQVADLELRYKCTAKTLDFDALKTDEMETFPHRANKLFGNIDIAILVFGYLGDQNTAQNSTNEILRIINTNFTAAAITLSHFANYFEKKKQGGIITISSVAGDRGRQSNYLYGASKGGLSILTQGLRNRLQKSGIHVMTVKPGFVDTPMTEGLDGLFLVAQPERIARDILRAYDKKKDILYTPFFWVWILRIIRFIPEKIFKRLSL